MTALKPVFRLESLPDVARDHYIRTCSMQEAIAFSMVNDDYKRRVRRAQFKIKQLKVSVGNKIARIDFGSRCDQVWMEFPKEHPVGAHAMSIPSTVMQEDICLSRNNRDMTFRQWLDHFMELFHCRNVILILMDGFCMTYSELESMFRGLDIKDAQLMGGHDEVHVEIIKNPSIEFLSINSKPILRAALAKPYIRLTVSTVFFPGSDSQFLMRSNCKHVDFVGGQHWIEDDINSYIRMFQNTDKVTMDSVYIVGRKSCPNFLDIALRGVEVRFFPEDQARNYPSDIKRIYFKEWPHFKGGFDFTMRDGSDATLIYKVLGNYIHYIIMFWH